MVTRIATMYDGSPAPLPPRPSDGLIAYGPQGFGPQADDAEILGAPADPTLWPQWRASLRAWREQCRARVGYLDTGYQYAGQEWNSSLFSMSVLWMWDERLYCREDDTVDVDRFMTTWTQQYGPLDGIVLWHAYPVIGIDDRNQFDFYLDDARAPAIVAAFQRHGVRVFINYNPWDTGTRPHQGGHAAGVVDVVRELGVDGVFLDTMAHGEPEFIGTIEDAYPTMPLASEASVPAKYMANHRLSWAQWYDDSEVPGALRAKVFEQRHMMHLIRRWDTDHREELWQAWLNGVGVLVWDNVFGSWLGWNERDSRTLRYMLAVQRPLAELLSAGQWTPLAAHVAQQGPPRIVGSSWRCQRGTLVCLANVGESPLSGPLLVQHDDGEPVAKEWTLLGPQGSVREHAGNLEVSLEPGELTAVWFGPCADVSNIERDIAVALAEVQHPEIAWRETASAAPSLATTMRIRECGLRTSPPYLNYTRPPEPPLHGVGAVAIAYPEHEFAIDSFEVTNAQFAEFVSASGYRPVTQNRFLAHWVEGQPAPGTETDAVTYVTIEDARAYASWAGARVASESEWHAAACQGQLRRSEPWVWNLTESEQFNGSTRWLILKGGCAYEALGSPWYFDGGPQAAGFSAQLVLPGGGLDRSERIGFRCVRDRTEQHRSESTGSTDDA